MTFFDLEHILTTLGVFTVSVFVAWLLVCFFRLVAALEQIADELSDANAIAAARSPEKFETLIARKEERDQ